MNQYDDTNGTTTLGLKKMQSSMKSNQNFAYSQKNMEFDRISKK